MYVFSVDIEYAGLFSVSGVLYGIIELRARRVGLKSVESKMVGIRVLEKGWSSSNDTITQILIPSLQQSGGDSSTT